MNAWSGLLPEVDQGGALGLWVAAVGQPGPSEPGWRVKTQTVLEAGPDRVFRLLLETDRLGPATASGSGCGVVFDGVLFDRGQLRSRLGGGAGPSPDDASLVLLAYQRWGREFVQHLKGIFAVVVWDSRDDTVLCARDRTGVYPLFYAERPGALLVSTSVEALRRRPGVAVELDRGSLAGVLVHHWIGPEDTHFAGMKRLPAGWLMEVRGRTRRASRYWNPVPLDGRMRWVREDELEQFDALLEQAVARCLDLGPAAIYLSGGIDSVGVATAAADLGRRRGGPMPVALLMDMSREGADETATQAAVAESLGLSQVRRAFADLSDIQTTLDHALERSSTWPWPLPHPTNIRYLNMGLEGKAHGCRVLLTGEGGDEWLAVHPMHGAQALRRLDLVGCWRLARVALASYPVDLGQVLRVNGWLFGLRPILAQVARLALERAAPGTIHARRRRAKLREVPDWLAPDPAVRRALEDRIDRDIDQDLHLPKPPGFYLPTVHRMLETHFEDDFEKSRRTGMRLLHPYWDADVVDFLARTPPALLSVGGRTKGLVRDRLARRFPALGFEKQKKLLLPNLYQDMIAARAPAAWEKHGGAPALAALGIVREDGLRRMMEGVFARRDVLDRPSQVWHVLNLEAWARPRAS